jgi:HEAT repeat protein
LKATEAVPELKKLLEENTATGGKYSGFWGLLGMMSGPNYSDVQVAAAEALIAILKTQAVPLIEKQFTDAAPATREDLLHAMESLDGNLFGFVVTNNPDSAFLLATWHRLSQSRLADVRKFAVQAILVRDEAQFVYDHPALLKDPVQEIRFRAVYCLVERGDKRAIPLLRTALQDSYSPTQVQAFRGLVKYQPDDILDILHSGAMHKDRAIRLKALAELVKRGDKEAIAAFVGRIAALKDHTHDREGWGTEEREAQEMCELVVNLKLSAAEPALRQAYANNCDKIRRPVCGALAALGDQDALHQLRQFIRVGDSLDRASSITMLSLVGDTASLPILRDALSDREPWVREAAKEAITHLEEKVTGPRTADPGSKR